MRIPTWLGLAAAAGVLAGCGPGKGRVSGQVLFNGKPLPGGWVTFQPAVRGHNPVSAEIDRDGNYSAVLPAVEQFPYTVRLISAVL